MKHEAKDELKEEMKLEGVSNASGVADPSP